MNKKFLLSILAVAVLSGCNSDNINSTISPETDTDTPLIPLEPSIPTKPVIPAIPLEPANQAESNLVFMATSTYPRSVLAGEIASRADDGNDTFDLYTHDVMPHGDVPKQLAENVNYKGVLKIEIPKDPTRESTETPNPEEEVEEALTKISTEVMKADPNKPVNLYMEESFPRRSPSGMTPEALGRVKSITIAIEGSGSITDTDRLSNVIAFAKQAQEAGVKEFNIGLFSSVDLDVLASQRPQWEEMINDQYINVIPVDFDKISANISDGYETEVLSNLIKVMGYDLETAFTKSESYDENKKLLVFFGSARSTYHNTAENKMGGNFNNMMIVDKYLADSTISSEYNVAIKPHPKLDWISRVYIPNYASDASYFSKVPFEMLVLAGGKTFESETGGYKLPVIDRVDSTYSTILFAVDKKKINSIIDYSDFEGFKSYSDTVEYMRDNYSLVDGWGFDGDSDHDGIKDIESYKELADKFTEQIDAPHVKVTNAYQFVTN